VIEERWSEDDQWEEEPVPVRQRAETIRYQEYEDDEDDQEADNWGEVEREPLVRYETPRNERDYVNNVDEDIWEDEAEPYNPPKINIPEKQKAPEYYEEEAG
jgi:hypothetical protein